MARPQAWPPTIAEGAAPHGLVWLGGIAGVWRGPRTPVRVGRAGLVVVGAGPAGRGGLEYDELSRRLQDRDAKALEPAPLQRPTAAACRGRDLAAHPAVRRPWVLHRGRTAMIVDPSTSKGVLRAAVTGAWAADAAVRGAGEGDAARYRDTLAAWFEHETESLDALYRTVTNPAS